MTAKINVITEQELTPTAIDVFKRAKQEALGDTPLELLVNDEHATPRLVLGKGEGDVTTLSVKQIVNKESAVTDLAIALRNVLNLPQQEEIQYEVIKDYGPLDRLGPVVMFDIEVAGDIETDLPSETPIISMAFSDGQNIFVVPEELCEGDPHNTIVSVLKSRTIVGHNARFDMRTVSDRLNDGEQIYAGHDTMLMHYSMNHGAKMHGLKPLAQKFFNAPEWEHDLKKYTVGGAHYENIPRDLLYQYNAFDVLYTGKLFSLFRDQLENDPPRRKLYLDHLMPLDHMYQDIESGGIPVDEDYFTRLSADLAQDVERNLWAMREVVEDHKFNPGSWQQVKKFVEGELGRAIPSTDEKTLTGVLKDLEDDHPVHEFITMLLDYRGTTKLRSTYAEGTLKRTRDGSVYPQFLLHGTTTGRTSCKGPNVQNQPRGPVTRSGFVASSPGHVVLSVDYSQIELRALAELSNDEAMIAAFQPGAVDYFDAMMPAAYPEKFVDVENFLLYKQAHPEEAKELRAQVKGVQYGCVTMDTRILTRRGWLTHSQVRPGDETPGLTGWTTVKEVVRYSDAPVERFGNSRWSVTTTPNHRWAVRKRVKRERSWGPVNMVHQHDIKSDDVIEVAAPVRDAFEDGFTDQEVRIISWLLSDGHVTRSVQAGRTSQGVDGQRRGIVATISQGKEPYVQHIHKVMEEVPHQVYHSKGANLPITHWRLQSAYARELWDRTGIEKTSVQDFVLGLNSRHRELFLEVFCHAEGHQDPQGTWLVTQKAGDKAEAILLAARLSGVRATVMRHSDGVVRIRLNKVRHLTAQTMKRTPLGNQDVWCVVTESGTWTMRQGDTVAITGNTNYGRGVRAIAEELGLSNEEADKLLNGIYNTYPGLEIWQTSVRRAVVDASMAYMLTTPFNRRFQSEVITSRNRNAVENAALAFVPQSTASDITQSAALQIHKRVGQFDARIVATIHDAIVFDVPIDKVEDVIKLAETEMVGAAASVFRRVEFAVQAEVGRSWADV